MPSKDNVLGLSRGKGLAAHGLLVLLGIPFLMPLIWMFTTSLKTDVQLASTSNDTLIESLIPVPPQWTNYSDAVQAVPFGIYLQNTLLLCALNVVAAVLSSAIVAYGFARFKFPGKNVLFMLVLATLAIPPQVTMIPLFLLFKWIGWYGTFLPLIVPAFFGSAFFIFLMRQFFMTLPEELSEAARIDGAGELRIFLLIALPLSKPALATCALFQFLYSWNDFFGPLIYLNDPEEYTLAYGLQQFIGSLGGEWTQLMAGATMFTIPMIIVFYLAQRTFIQGIATTGGK